MNFKSEDKINPGRELDALIAEKVMGLNLVNETEIDTRFLVSWSKISNERYVDLGPGDGVNSLRYTSIPRFSTDIAAAWEVVEKLGLSVVWLEHRKKWWSGELEVCNLMDEIFDDGWPESDTAPHAICLAALKAVSSNHPQGE